MTDYEIRVYADGAGSPRATGWFSRESERDAKAYLGESARSYTSSDRLDLCDAAGLVVASCHGKVPVASTSGGRR